MLLRLPLQLQIVNLLQHSPVAHVQLTLRLKNCFHAIHDFTGPQATWNPLEPEWPQERRHQTVQPTHRMSSFKTFKPGHSGLVQFMLGDGLGCKSVEEITYSQTLCMQECNLQLTGLRESLFTGRSLALDETNVPGWREAKPKSW